MLRLARLFRVEETCWLRRTAVRGKRLRCALVYRRWFDGPRYVLRLETPSDWPIWIICGPHPHAYLHAWPDDLFPRDGQYDLAVRPY